MLVALEGHGREEDVVPGADLSRTVGWFTSIFPVRLDPGPVDVADALAGGPAAGSALKRVKEQLRAVPDRGLGYGLLRHLNPETAAELAALPAPQISFNYLGRFAVGHRPAHWTAGARRGRAGRRLRRRDAGRAVHAGDQRVHRWTARTGRGCGVTWAYPADAARRASRRATWPRAGSPRWRRWSRHAAAPGAGGHTPSDLTLVGLSQDEIDEFEAEWEPYVSPRGRPAR